MVPARTAATVERMPGRLRFSDDDGVDVLLDAAEAQALLATTGDLEAATVSACPDCHSKVVAAVALVDLLDAAPPNPRSGELVELADEGPTLHLYVVDEDTECTHARWRDPGYGEWLEAIEEPRPHPRS